MPRRIDGRRAHVRVRSVYEPRLRVGHGLLPVHRIPHGSLRSRDLPRDVHPRGNTTRRRPVRGKQRVRRRKLVLRDRRRDALPSAVPTRRGRAALPARKRLRADGLAGLRRVRLNREARVESTNSGSKQNGSVSASERSLDRGQRGCRGRGLRREDRAGCSSACSAAARVCDRLGLRRPSVLHWRRGVPRRTVRPRRRGAVRRRRSMHR